MIVHVHEVLAFQADEKLALARTPDRRFTSEIVLKEVEKGLDPETICRLQQQTIIQLKHARELHALTGAHYLLGLSDGSDVEVSRRLSRDLRVRFGELNSIATNGQLVISSLPEKFCDLTFVEIQGNYLARLPNCLSI